MGVSCAALRRCVFVYYGIAENGLGLKSLKCFGFELLLIAENGSRLIPVSLSWPSTPFPMPVLSEVERRYALRAMLSALCPMLSALKSLTPCAMPHALCSMLSLARRSFSEGGCPLPSVL